MKYLFLICFSLFICTTSFAQEENEPQEKYKVTKEYDENGNLVRYDSSYVKSWSGSNFISEEQMEAIQEQMANQFDNFNMGEFFNEMSDSMESFMQSEEADSLLEQFGASMQDYWERNDSVIYTYPLDSTMMEPIEKFMTPENMERMQEAIEQQMQEMFAD